MATPVHNAMKPIMTTSLLRGISTRTMARQVVAQETTPHGHTTMALATPYRQVHVVGSTTRTVVVTMFMCRRGEEIITTNKDKQS